MQESGQPTNPEVLLESLIKSLIESHGRAVRQRLAKALDSARDRPEPPRRVLGRRQGQAVEWVVAVLRAAPEPMAPREIIGAIHGRYGELLDESTVRHTLRRGPLARAGQIVRVGAGLYEMAQDGS
jgi:hypothetical protein